MFRAYSLWLATRTQQKKKKRTHLPAPRIFLSTSKVCLLFIAVKARTKTPRMHYVLEYWIHLLLNCLNKTHWWKSPSWINHSESADALHALLRQTETTCTTPPCKFELAPCYMRTQKKWFKRHLAREAPVPMNYLIRMNWVNQLEKRGTLFVLLPAYPNTEYIRNQW